MKITLFLNNPTKYPLNPKKINFLLIELIFFVFSCLKNMM